MLYYKVTVKRGDEVIASKNFELTAQPESFITGLREAIDLMRRKHPNVGLMDGEISFTIARDA